MAENQKNWLAGPPSDCCLNSHMHQGSPQGVFQDVAGLETYVSRPLQEKNNGHILLYFPDVWGMFKNGLLIMDSFADAGYLVIGPDYFRGDPVWKHRKDRHDKTTDPDFDYEAWKAKHTSFADKRVPEWTRCVKETFGGQDTKYACVGYCFGAPYVCDALAKPLAGKPACTVGAFAHPAFLNNGHFEQLDRPLFMSCAEVDHTFPTAARNKAVELCIDRGKTYHLQLFAGVEHGFALRGDMSKPCERWVKETSLKGIVAWFDFWLGLDS